MPGLINTQLQRDDDILDPSRVRTAGTVGYDPERRGVAANETVAGQMNTLLGGDSSYITRARTRAAEFANSRGLLNSTMAAQAGEAAAIDASLPIASQDAGTFNLAARENQAAGNRAFEFGAGATNTANLQGAEAFNQVGRIRTQGRIESGLIGDRAAAESRLQTERAGHETGLVGTRATAESRLQAERAGHETGLVGTRAAAESRLQAERAGHETGLVGTRAAAESRLQAERAGHETGLVGTRATAESRLQAERAGHETGLVGTRAAAESRLQAERGEIERGLVKARADADVAIQQLRGDQSKTLANIEANFKQLIQASSSASSVFKDALGALTVVMADTATSKEQKQLAVDKLMQVLKANLTVAGAIANIDIAGLLNFGPP